MGGGAWPFLVGGLICLVNSDNERDHNLLNSGGNKYFMGECGVRCVKRVKLLCISTLMDPLFIFFNFSLLRGTP